MKIICALTLFVLSSCSSIVFEAGHTNRVLPPQIKSHVPINALHLSVRPTTSLPLSSFVTLDSGIGATLITSLSSYLIGPEHHLRLRLTPPPDFPIPLQPYILTANGVLYGQGWAGTDVSYAFSTQFGVGVQYDHFTIDYRWFHHSNGMTFHSDEFRRFFGLATPHKNEGFENGAIFVGWAFDL